MALSTKTRKRVEVALARRDAAKELCDAVDSADAGSVTLTSAHILVGNVSNVAADVALSGDATMANTGALTIAALAVTSGKLAAGAVTSAKLGAGAVTNAALGAAAVQAANISFFKSNEITGTGSSQSTAHGLGSTPGLVIVQVTDALAGDSTFVEGAHDGTNVIVTATSGAKYKVIAIK